MNDHCDFSSANGVPRSGAADGRTLRRSRGGYQTRAGTGSVTGNGNANGNGNGHLSRSATDGHRFAPWDVDDDGARRRYRVLAIGAHPDDIELGCGGTLIAHRARGDQVTMLVMSKGERGPDALSRVAEQEEASRILGASLHWGDFDDAAIPDSREAVDLIQDVMRCVRPDVVYTHTPNDSHQDHRAVASATLAATRRFCRLLQYEAPSSLAFDPTIFVDIRDAIEGKLDALRAHTSQVLRNGLVDLEAIEAQARYRGFQARLRLAEAFQAERFVWDLTSSSDVRGSNGGLLLEEVNGC